MEAFRKESQGEAEKRGAKMTPVVFLIKDCVAALKKYPQFNASLSTDGETIILKHYYHIGIAVDTPDGLLVPVLRNCDQKSLLELAVELGELSQRARIKKLSLDEIQGGCFTISSLGGIGGTAFTPSSTHLKSPSSVSPGPVKNPSINRENLSHGLFSLSPCLMITGSLTGLLRYALRNI